MTNSFTIGPLLRSRLILLVFRSQNALVAGKMMMRQPNQIHCQLQILFILYNERDVSCFRRPTVWACFAFRKNPLLITLLQSDVAVTATMDMHEHCSSDKKRVLVDSGILPLRHTGQVENPLP